MPPLFELVKIELKPVHDMPEMWTADHYRQTLQALEFDGIDEIETADLPEMAIMALQDLKPAAAAEVVLKILLGDRLNAGIRQNLAHEMKEGRLWEEYPQTNCHADLFLTAVLLNRAFPKVYTQPEIGRLILSVTAQNSPAAKLLAAEPSAGFVARLIGDGMDDHSILKRLYAPQLAGEAFPEAPGIIWYSQVRARQEAGLELLVYSSWYWLRPLINVRQYQSTAGA